MSDSLIRHEPQPRDRDRLAALVTALLADDLTSSERQELNGLLRGHEELRDEFVSMVTHARMLASRLAPEQRAALADDQILHPAEVKSPKPTVLLRAWRQTTAVLNRPVLWSILAFALVFYGTFTVISWNLWPHQLPGGTDSNQESIATVGNVRGVRWATGATAKAPNAQVKPGERLKIDTGIVGFGLSSGAQVSIEGPGELAIDATNRATLHSGRLVAHVPAEAVGFTVTTPTAKIVDLGTDFAVAVDSQGNAAVHVLNGKVRVSTVNRPGQKDSSVELHSGQSLECRGNGVIESPGKANHQEFAALLRATRNQRPKKQGSTIAYWRFEDQVPHVTTEETFANAIPDASGHGQHLSFWSGYFRNAVGPYRSSERVPPTTMFAAGYSGGKRSFDSAGLNPEGTGALFHDSLLHGKAFAMNGDFTLEGYFRAEDDQSSNGELSLISMDPNVRNYAVRVNSEARGSLAFTVWSRNLAYTVTLKDKNYVDGSWHYFAACFTQSRGDSNAKIRLIAGHEDGTHRSASLELPAGFAFEYDNLQPNANLILGRRRHVGTVVEHFRGQLDEVRVSRALLKDEELLFPLTQTPQE